MFNMSKEEKFNFDIANLKQDFAIENMNITDSDIEILKKYSNEKDSFYSIFADNIPWRICPKRRIFTIGKFWLSDRF